MATHTYAVLDVPATVFAAVKALLTAADYGHAFDRDLIDMHGIALRAREGGKTEGAVTVSSMLSSRTKKGRVELAVNGEVVQLDLDKARLIVDMLQDATEAAVSDELIYEFLTTKVGLDDERATMAVGDFREMRQGTRGLVNPS